MTESWPTQAPSHRYVGAGKIFRLGEQEFVKSNRENQTQNITLYNRYFFKKKLGGFGEFFVFKVTLKSVRLFYYF